MQRKELGFFDPLEVWAAHPQKSDRAQMYYHLHQPALADLEKAINLKQPLL